MLDLDIVREVKKRFRIEESPGEKVTRLLKIALEAMVGPYQGMHSYAGPAQSDSFCADRDFLQSLELSRTGAIYQRHRSQHRTTGTALVPVQK